MSRARSIAGQRGATAYGPSCVHCGTPRIVAPLSELRGFCRKHAQLVDVLGALEEMREWYNEDELVSLCPRCFCVTGDLNHR